MRQKQALNVMMGGVSVFLTGAPGSGKTFILNEFVRRAEKAGKRVAVTASTGIAATHLGGTTIHSWSGLGIRDQLSATDKQWLTANDRLTKRYNATDVLVIDEVSMLHGQRLDMVNEACKLLRKSEQPFGGLQVILVGDLFQLPPVTRGSEQFDFVHTSKAWAELNPQICYLSEQHRQQRDGLLTLLEAMRRGEVGEDEEQSLTERLGQTPPAEMIITRLYAHNADVDAINQRELTILTSDIKTFTMQTKGAASKVEQLTKSILAPETLELKVGAEVMFVANDFAAGFVNGSRGRVVEFVNNMPRVKLASTGREIVVEPHTWTLSEDGRERAQATQLPLRLAWAITIHKSQGMSLDAAEIDLSRTFTPGMGYVALSRVRSLDGVYLLGINRQALALHPDMYDFDALLREASKELASSTPDAPDASEADEAEQAAAPDEALLTKLKQWRLAQANAAGVPAYIVAHNTVLEAIATRPPTSAQALLGLKGFGPKKFETYGEELLKLIVEHTGVRLSETPAEPAQSLESTQLSEDRAKLRAAIMAEYPKAGKRWTAEEDAELLALFQAGTTLTEVCAKLQRSPAGVWLRLSQLVRSENSSVGVEKNA